MKNLQKELEDVVKERDSLSNEVKVIKEKTQPEHALELQEKFYDGSGLLDVKAMEKISEEAGRDIETMLKNTMVQYKSQ